MTTPLDASPCLPSQILFRFPSRRCNPDPMVAVPDNYIKTLSLSDIGKPHSGWPSALTLHDDALAEYATAAGPPTNQAALDALAVRFATDLLAWRLDNFDRVYDGVLNTVSPFYDNIKISYSMTGATTRVVSGCGREPEELMHHDPAFASTCNDNHVQGSCARLFGPPLSGATSLIVNDVCITDGRLKQTYVETKNVSCGCSSSSCFLHFTVKCCGRPTAGAAVNVSGPSGFTGACTTDGTGVCTVPIPGVGTYTGTVTPPGGGCNPASFTRVVTACSGPQAVAVNLGVSYPYSCDNDQCCTIEPGPPYLPVTWPASVTIDDGFGTVTLSQYIPGRPAWRGIATRFSSTPTFDCNCRTGRPAFPCGCSTPRPAGGSWPVQIYYEVACGSIFNNTAGIFRAGLGYYPCKITDPVACAIDPAFVCRNSGIPGLAVGESSGCGMSSADPRRFEIGGPGGSGTWPTISYGGFGEALITTDCTALHPTVAFETSFSLGPFNAECSFNFPPTPSQILGCILRNIYGQQSCSGSAFCCVIPLLVTS